MKQQERYYGMALLPRIFNAFNLQGLHLSEGIIGAHMLRYTIFILFLIIAVPISLNAAPAKGIGIWVWSEAAFLTKEARQNLIQYCAKHQISHLDIHIRFTRHNGIPSLKDAGNIKDLILLAGQNNITTAALRGNPKMFFSDNHEQTLRELRAIIAFGKTLPEGNLFKGVKYDVEPYLTKEWKAKGASLKVVMLNYLTCLHRARSLLDEEASHLWLAVDMPFWWDKDEFVLEFRGEKKRFSEHVQDVTDFTVLMSYRRNTGQVLSAVENERRYARQINKVIFLSLETSQLMKDGYISFWGLPAKELWKVVPRLLETAKTDQAIGGVMIHCYRSLVEILNNNNPNKPVEGEALSLRDKNINDPVSKDRGIGEGNRVTPYLILQFPFRRRWREHKNQPRVLPSRPDCLDRQTFFFLFIMRPHSDNFHGLDFVENLVNQTVL